MKYIIRIKYETGDSYKTSVKKNNLEIKWGDIESAKKALQYIKEHHIFYQVTNESWKIPSKARLDYLESCKDKAWYVESNPYTSIKLYTDKNKVWQISPFWIGTFECLLKAKILEDKSSLIYDPSDDEDLKNKIIYENYD